MARVWVSGTSKKFGTPTYFFATVEASNVKFDTQLLGLGIAYQKTTFRTKISEGPGSGEHPKKLGPLLISATVKASNFTFGTQLGFGTSLPKKQRLGPKLAGVWAKETSKKIGTPTHFCNR